MTVFKLVGIALLAVSAAVVLRAYRPELALQLSIVACLFILAYALSDIGAIRQAVDGVAARFGLGADQLKLVFKVIGIAYVVQFAAEACRDAGESAIASKVELAGRVLIVAAALPALMAVLSLLSGLLQKP